MITVLEVLSMQTDQPSLSQISQAIWGYVCAFLGCFFLFASDCVPHSEDRFIIALPDLFFKLNGLPYSFDCEFKTILKLRKLMSILSCQCKFVSLF